MQSLKTFVLVGVVGSGVLGCKSDEVNGTQLIDLTGAWHATQAQVTSVANPLLTANLILAGLTLQVVFGANHTFTTTTTLPGNPPETDTGTYTQTATTLTLTNDQSSGGEVIVFGLAVNNSGALVLTGGSIPFDFGAGEVASRLDVTLVH